MSVILTKNFFLVLENVRENYCVSGFLTHFLSLSLVAGEAAVNRIKKKKKEVKLAGPGPGTVASKSSSENGCGEGGQRWGGQQRLLGTDRSFQACPALNLDHAIPLRHPLACKC